jgi:hypothetical protein
VNAVLLGSNASLVATHDASDDRQCPVTTTTSTRETTRSPPFRTAGSSIVHPEKAKFLFPSAAQNIKEKNVDAHNDEVRSHSRHDDLNFSLPKKESSRLVGRKAHHNNVKTEGSNAMVVGGRMQLPPGEKLSPPREKSSPSSRPTSRGTNSGVGNTRLLSLKKVNLGFESEPPLPSVSAQIFTHFSPSDTKRNLGTRAHAMMPQVVAAKVVSVGSTKSCCKNANNASQPQEAHVASIESATTKKQEAKVKMGELILEELWSNLMCDVFDDIFRVCKKTHHLNNSWSNDRYVDESPTKVRSPFQAQQLLTIQNDMDDLHHDLSTGK